MTLPALIVEPAPETTPGACRACKGTAFWISVYGVTVCTNCHPPASRALVHRYVGTMPKEPAA